MNQRQVKVTSSIGERLAQKMSGKVGYRADLHLADYETINPKAARALIGYKASLGKPDSAEIEAFVLKVLGGKIVADLTNARNKADHHVVECVLKVPTRSRPIEDSNRMQTIVAGVRFMDVDLGDVWETESDDDGESKRLVQVSRDNIDDILLARRRAMMSRAGSVTFASIADEDGELDLAKDDYVTAYLSGESKQGVIASVGNDLVKIRLPNGKVVRAAKSAVLRVEAKASRHGSDHIQFLRDFYKEFMAADMVDKLYPPNKSEENLA